MSNGTNTPFGLRPVRSLTGATTNFQVSTCLINPYTPYSIYENVPVRTQGYNSIDDFLAPSSDNTDLTGYLQPAYPVTAQASIDTAGAIFPACGVFKGCEYYDLNGIIRRSNKWLTGTPIYPGTYIKGIYYSDPQLVYQVQCSNYITKNESSNQYLGLTQNRISTYAFPALFVPSTGIAHVQNIPLYLNFAGSTTNGNPQTSGNDVTGLSNLYLDLNIAAVSPQPKSLRLFCVGLATTAGNQLTPIPGTSTTVGLTTDFNIAEVILLDHIAKVVPPLPTALTN